MWWLWIGEPAIEDRRRVSICSRLRSERTPTCAFTPPLSKSIEYLEGENLHRRSDSGTSCPMLMDRLFNDRRSRVVFCESTPGEELQKRYHPGHRAPSRSAMGDTLVQVASSSDDIKVLKQLVY